MSRRLLRELGLLSSELPPYIRAVPREDDIHKVDVIFAYMPHDDANPRAAPYAHGVYWFTLTIPKEYPHGGLSFFAWTPSGRFTREGNICLSETRFQSKTVNTAVTISGFLTSAALYMTTENSGEVGYVSASDSERWKLAVGSMAWNLARTEFRRAFPDLIDDMQVNQLLLDTSAKPVKRTLEPSSIGEVVEIPAPPPKKARVQPKVTAPAIVPPQVTDSILIGENTRAVSWTVGAPGHKRHDYLQRCALPERLVSAITGFAAVPKTVSGLLEWTNMARQVPVGLIDAAKKIDTHVRDAILEYNMPPSHPIPVGALSKLAIPLLPHQEEIFGTLLELDRTGGGFLADAPGLGKTVMMAAVVVARDVKLTLIITSTKLVPQWNKEMVRMGVPKNKYIIITRGKMFVPRHCQRIIVDEAHQLLQISSALRMRLVEARYYGNTVWLVSGTPTDACFATYNYSQDSSYTNWMKRAIVRARSDVALDLPPMHEWSVVLELTAEQRQLYDRIASILQTAISRDSDFGHRSWHRFKLVLNKLFRALTTGRFDDVLEEVKVYEVHSTDEENTARSLRLNRPGPGARVGDWLIFAGHNSAECPVCTEPLKMDEAVFFSKCRHITCEKCFDTNMRTVGTPHCGLPCNRTTYGECYLMSTLLQIVSETVEEEPASRPMPTGPIASVKIDRMMQIVRAAGLVNQRVAIASHDMELIHSLGKMLGNPAKLTQLTAGASVGGILDRITSGNAPVLLIHTQCANAGLNLQHYHHVVLMDESIDPTEERQLLARFCRMGATVDRVLVHHLVMANTIEQRLAYRRGTGAPQPREVVGLLQ